MCRCSKCGTMIPCSLAMTGFPCPKCNKPEDILRWIHGKGFKMFIENIEKRQKIIKGDKNDTD